MATPRRGRQSTAPRRPTQGPTPLPAYQPPSCPLNDAAQRSLLALSQTRDVNRLKDHIRRGHETLQDSATEINERLQSKLAQQERADARRAESGREEDAESRALVEEMKQKVEELTRNMEAGVRTMIDAQATIEAVEKALGEVHHAIVDGGGAAHPTQSTLGASQHRSQNRRRPANSEDEGNGEEENEESIQPVVGPLDLLKRKMAEHEAQYGQLALRARYASLLKMYAAVFANMFSCSSYAQHNDYVSFKKTVHDAMHPGEDAPPLPHASTWFPDPNSQPSSGANGNEDEGSDIEVASERISIKCPLTLLPMVDPVTSKKCPHSFERNAIMEMISQSTVRIGGGRSGEKMMKCPVCEVVRLLSPCNPPWQFKQC